LTVIDVQGAEQVPVMPDGDEVVVKSVIADPPLEAGGVKLTLAWPLPAVATPIVGAPGTETGITLFEAAEGAPGPCALVPVTVNV
jgi:hypothetical protein